MFLYKYGGGVDRINLIIGRGRVAGTCEHNVLSGPIKGGEFIDYVRNY
jgi:hypothetical protein